MAASIVSNRIAGTRITVWDVVYYLEKRRSLEEIAGILSLSDEQLREARGLLERVHGEAVGRKQPSVREHVSAAIREITVALEIR